MGVLLEDQESESRRLGPWLELPQSPPRSVWAAVVAAWVSCCLRCRRLAQAGCAVDGVGSFAACAAPPPDADPASSGRKAAATRSDRVGKEGRSRWWPIHYKKKMMNIDVNRYQCSNYV